MNALRTPIQSIQIVALTILMLVCVDRFYSFGNCISLCISTCLVSHCSAVLSGGSFGWYIGLARSGEGFGSLLPLCRRQWNTKLSCAAGSLIGPKLTKWMSHFFSFGHSWAQDGSRSGSSVAQRIERLLIFGYTWKINPETCDPAGYDSLLCMFQLFTCSLHSGYGLHAKASMIYMGVFSNCNKHGTGHPDTLTGKQ